MSEHESTGMKILESIGGAIVGIVFFILPILFFILPVLFLVHPLIESSRSIPPEPVDERLESVDFEIFDSDRSSRLISVRREHISKNPECVACGSRKDLNVHHIKPFHSHPELELDPANLITLCREHHFRIGHDPDGPWKPRSPSWSESNPRVRKDAQRWRESQ